jgi:hypothetical protein
MYRVLLAFVLSVVPVLMVGCGGGGGGGGGSSYEGQWAVDKQEMKLRVEAALKDQLKGITEDLIKQQIEEAKAAIEQTSTSLRLHKGGTFSFVTTQGLQAQTRSGTWKPDGGSIILSTPGQPDVKARIKGGKLLVENKTGQGPAETVLIRVQN